MTLEIITADVLTPFRHGFFTRKGGASSGIFRGLNCGPGSSDQADAVAINRRRAAHALGGEAGDLVGVRQEHTDRALAVAGPDDARGHAADALVTDRPGLILSVLTADCAPVLFADGAAGVVGAAHAGWRGALGGVLEATLAAMAGLGARAGRIQAVVGPTISQRAYEVGPEFLRAFVDETPANGRFFASGAGDRLHFDLPGYVLSRLRRAGIGHAEWSRHCTYCDAERFFSYRRSRHDGQADYGRLIAAIRL